MKQIIVWKCALCGQKTLMGVEEMPQGWRAVKTGKGEKALCAACTWKVAQAWQGKGEEEMGKPQPQRRLRSLEKGKERTYANYGGYAV